MIYQGDALQYILETPDILYSILKEEDAVLAESRQILSEKNISEIYLTGSGSSYNSAAAVSAFGQKLLGIRVTPVYPAALMEEISIISKDAVVLGISQQGTSTAVIRALDAVREAEISAISVTGEYDTEITHHGDGTIYVECGYEDAGATTKGYTATVLILMLFFIMAAEVRGKISSVQGKHYRERIAGVIANMKSVLRESRPWCEQVAEELKDSSNLVILSGSTERGALLEGVLKFSETCRFPVRGYEAEEFMHGMYNAVTDTMDFLYLFPERSYEQLRMERLYEYYQKQGIRQYAIHMPEGRHEGKGILKCRFVNDPYFSVLEYVLPQQMLFVMTSRARGIDLNVPKDPEFHKYMGSKLE